MCSYLVRALPAAPGCRSGTISALRLPSDAKSADNNFVCYGHHRAVPISVLRPAAVRAPDEQTLSQSNPLNDEEAVLVAIRKIMRAADIHSRRLSKTAGLTVPQLLLLQAIRNLGAVAISRLSTELNLSQATVTTILDRLEQRGLAVRRRSDRDKRVVNAYLTEAGEAVLAKAPPPLQERFSAEFAKLEDWEKSMILASLQRVAALMKADDIDASPLLDYWPADR